MARMSTLLRGAQFAAFRLRVQGGGGGMHRIHASVASAGVAVLWLGLSLPAIAQEPPTNTHGTQPDNTKVNRPSAINADTQKNDKHDLAITQDIRKAIMADKSLSTY